MHSEGIFLLGCFDYHQFIGVGKLPIETATDEEARHFKVCTMGLEQISLFQRHDVQLLAHLTICWICNCPCSCKNVWNGAIKAWLRRRLRSADRFQWHLVSRAHALGFRLFFSNDNWQPTCPSNVGPHEHVVDLFAILFLRHLLILICPQFLIVPLFATGAQFPAQFPTRTNQFARTNGAWTRPIV